MKINIFNYFNRHPESVGESYFEHLIYAFCLALQFFIIGLIAITHGLFPFLFEYTASQKIIQLAKKFEQRNRLVRNDELKTTGASLPFSLE